MTEPGVETARDAPTYTSADPAPKTPGVEACPSCGGAIDGRFCRECGERRPGDRVYSLREFAQEAFEAITNVERSFLRTLWTLVRRPGELTLAYMRGERVRYLRPLQLFLIVNVLFFIIGAGGINAYTTRYNNHLYGSPYRKTAQALVVKRLPSSGMTYDEYRKAFDEKVVVLAKTLVIFMAPAFALGVAVLSFRKRKPAVQHLVFGLHFTAVVLLLTVSTFYVMYGAMSIWRMLWNPSVAEPDVDQFMGLLMVTGIVAYLIPAFRRAYGDGRIAAVVKALVSIGLVVEILVLYRMLLFYATVFSL